MFKTRINIICIVILLLATLTGIILYMRHPVRYAVFAGYNADHTIHPYIITYLKGLNEVTDGVVYIADSELKPEEYEKLNGLVIHTEHKRHGEYDWGSYKRGYNWLKDNGYLEKADELIFANDSCYAPMESFKPMFKEMAKRTELDFWGDLQNTKFTTHLQSYFMVFRPRVFLNRKFATFINNITHQIDSSLYITNYEITLTPELQKIGFKWDSYMPYKRLKHLKTSDKNSYPYTMISKYNHQFLKRRTFTEKLMILESTDDLLHYIHQNFPERYKDIAQEIAPHFIPEDLKGQADE